MVTFVRATPELAAMTPTRRSGAGFIADYSFHTSVALSRRRHSLAAVPKPDVSQ
jgi:hypothetical protein